MPQSGLFKALLLLLFTLSFIQDSFAVPSGAVKLKDSDLAQVYYSGKTYLCGKIKSVWIPGRLVSSFFISTQREIANTKRELKAAASDALKRKLQSRVNAFTVRLASGAAACALVESGITPTPTPSPTPTSNGYFDATGNVTDAGKVAFEIPSNLGASVNRGIQVWNSKCFGCHQTGPGMLGPNTYTAIRNRIQQSPMSFIIPGEITDQQVADVVAYRNF